MQVILVKDIEKLGKKGDSVNVRDGFARNFLIPHSFAVTATKENLKLAEIQQKREAGRKEKKRTEAEKLGEQVAATLLKFQLKVGEKDKVFGSVTAQELSDALAEKGFSVDKKHIRLTEPLRSLGKHGVTLELAPEVKVTLQVEIVKKS